MFTVLQCGAGDGHLLKSRRDVLQMVLVEVFAAEQDFGTAHDLLKPVCCRWPASIRVWNTYCRSAYRTQPPDCCSKAMGTSMVLAACLLNILQSCPRNAHTCKVQAHDHFQIDVLRCQFLWSSPL